MLAAGTLRELSLRSELCSNKTFSLVNVNVSDRKVDSASVRNRTRSLCMCVEVIFLYRTCIYDAGQRPVRKHLVHFGARSERESVRLQDLCYVQYKQKERVETERRRERIVSRRAKVKRNQAKREKRERRIERRLLHFIRRGEERTVRKSVRKRKRSFRFPFPLFS